MTLVDEWVAKAEADYRGAVALNRQRAKPLPDLVCYHCQQSAEKYLKAFLISQDMVPPRIHDLVQLLNVCVLYDSTLARYMSSAEKLNPYGVLIRYPGLSATATEARDALQAVRRLRSIVRRRLGI